MPGGGTRRLVIDTATAACSVALLDGDVVLAATHELVGRGHAERLMPMIAALPDGGRADSILIDCGPGSFTGVRVGLATARALGLGWGVPVCGYSATALLAAMAQGDDTILAVAMTGGHGELFVQRYSRNPLTPIGTLASLLPADAANRTTEETIFGSGAEALVAARATGRAVDLLPDAAQAWRLPADLAKLPAQPIYGRDADAKLPA
ncbi:tRNA (adenosine(37)-N6)-threonylcarbamoyltransferase complex dimerization subunit type 1 TsaB [Sphingomonas montanisoli]|uniref:tRNA (Adenosine(37)-N6)-threonylcarbamoyltransferase complex dimerization subunit type 1 TsaB n=1 Tax=Sphingomonas montanisoli TaxID=2606412 RepID=A0A5D9C8A1_9SPHN|nr:tRNA (adenosine(37)-N6)-threonylcarbamoyltransferase complex dimerization subunit type 1 TsaB [Sphingomonas montanisoli]TZG28014.1 tRNA (adenosine(37)-N6)-threonylcarbamoyltransferase complex dimerization subunit type 1 TsaB [Sphingomonas montanisoli]